MGGQGAGSEQTGVGRQGAGCEQAGVGGQGVSRLGWVGRGQGVSRLGWVGFFVAWVLLLPPHVGCCFCCRMLRPLSAPVA